MSSTASYTPTAPWALPDKQQVLHLTSHAQSPKGELKPEFHTEEAVLSLLHGNSMVALEQVTVSRKRRLFK
jgi:hypothetical protein